jgi:hypothetical protein
LAGALGESFSSCGRGRSGHQQRLKKSVDASFAALLDLARPDFAGKSCADLGIESGSRLAAAAALPFFNRC